MVQWLRLHASTEGGMGFIPDQGTKIPHTLEQLSRCTTTREPVCHQQLSPRATTSETHEP